MSALETYARAVRKAKGVEHKYKLDALRWYIKRSTDKELITAIRRITDTELMRTLIEAGLNAALMTVLLRRYDDLVTRKARR